MSVFGDALRLIAEMSPRMDREQRTRAELLADEAGAAWTYQGESLVVTFPNGDPDPETDSECDSEDCECSCYGF